MKLKLRSDLMNSQTQSVINKNLETNLKLNIPAEVAPPADMKEFVKGMIMLGILADVSFPMGSDDGFKHVAGTGFSGHAELFLLVSPPFSLPYELVILLSEHKQKKDLADFSYEDTYSQIPILLGAYYMIPTGSGFQTLCWIGVGVFFETYKVNWTEDYGFGEPFTLDDSFTSTGFGVVPASWILLLTWISCSTSCLLNMHILFSEGPTVEYDYVVPTVS